MKNRKQAILENVYKILSETKEEENRLRTDLANLEDIAKMGSGVHPILRAAQDPRAKKATEAKLAALTKGATGASNRGTGPVKDWSYVNIQHGGLP